MRLREIRDPLAGRILPGIERIDVNKDRPRLLGPRHSGGGRARRLKITDITWNLLRLNRGRNAEIENRIREFFLAEIEQRVPRNHHPRLAQETAKLLNTFLIQRRIRTIGGDHRRTQRPGER